MEEYNDYNDWKKDFMDRRKRMINLLKELAEERGTAIGELTHGHFTEEKIDIPLYCKNSLPHYWSLAFYFTAEDNDITNRLAAMSLMNETGEKLDR